MARKLAIKYSIMNLQSYNKEKNYGRKINANN